MAKLWTTWLACLGILFTAATAAVAQTNERPKLGILEVQATPALEQKLAQQRGQGELSLRRITQSLDGQLMDRLFQIRRYDLVARADMEVLLKDVDLQQAFTANPVEAFRMAGCDYGLIVTLDDFNDESHEQRGEGGQVIQIRRTVRMSAVAKIYDIEKGVLVGTTNVQIGPKISAQRVQPGVSGGSGDQFGGLLTDIAREFASKTAMALLDTTMPAKVVAVSGEEVAVNRGAGTGIEVGQEWVIYGGSGEPITDPDTGEVLGVEEVEIGRIVIERVNEKMSWGRAKEDLGIARSCIARRKPETP